MFKELEGQVEFDVGEAAFSNVERSMNLLKKQFMLENVDTLGSISVS